MSKNQGSLTNIMIMTLRCFPILLRVAPVLSPRVASKACSALFCALLSSYCVLFSSFVAATPMGFCSSMSILHVPPVSDSFKMLRVNTGPVFTQMVDFQIRMNRPMVNFVGDAMGRSTLVAKHDSAISAMISVPGEQPTALISFFNPCVKPCARRQALPRGLKKLSTTSAAEGSIKAALDFERLLAMWAGFCNVDSLSRFHVAIQERASFRTVDPVFTICGKRNRAPKAGLVVHGHLRVTPEFSKGEAGLGVAGVRAGHDSRGLSPIAVYAFSS